MTRLKAVSLVLVGALAATLLLPPAVQAQLRPGRFNLLTVLRTITVGGALNLAATPTNGVLLQNTTPATVGTTSQYAPSSTWCGSAWNSIGVAAETDCLRLTVKPTTTAGATTFNAAFDRSIAGGAYGTFFALGSAGVISLVGPSTSVGGIINAQNSDASTNMRIFSDTSNGYVGTSTNSPLLVQVFASEAARFTASGIGMGGSGVLSFSNVAPTLSSGFGTSPVFAGRGTSFQVNVGTGGVASSGIIAMNATANQGWTCDVFNITALAANRADQRTVQTTGGTTTVTVQNQTISTGAALAWTASDVLRLTCAGY